MMQYMIRFDTISNLFKLVKTCANLFKLVQTCSKLQYDEILLNLMQFDTIRHDFIWFYKHVQTCHNAMIWFDTILQTCLNLSKKMTKYIKIHLKFLRNVFFFLTTKLFLGPLWRASGQKIQNLKKIVKIVTFRGNSGNSGGDGVLNSNQQGTGQGKTAGDLGATGSSGYPWHP